MEAGGRHPGIFSTPQVGGLFGQQPGTAWGADSGDLQAAIGELEEKLKTLRRKRDEADSLQEMGERSAEIETIVEDLAQLRFRHLGALDAPVASTQPASSSPSPKSTGFGLIGTSAPKPFGTAAAQKSEARPP